MNEESMPAQLDLKAPTTRERAEEKRKVGGGGYSTPTKKLSSPSPCL